MQQIFVYEFVVGGGTLGSPRGGAPAESLLQEGAAMLGALVEDFARIAGVRVVTQRDRRWTQWPMPAAEIHDVASAEQELATLARLAEASNWTVLIAPEFDGELERRARLVEQCGGRLLSPSADCVAICSDKSATHARLRVAAVPMPRGMDLTNREQVPTDWRFPAVLKPRDGAGSIGVRLVADRDAIDLPSDWRWRLEEYHPGAACSIAWINGRDQTLVLPACRQHQSAGGRFQYLGGSTPLAADRDARMQWLARRVAELLPRGLGYQGLDAVLGDGPDDDRVIEVNPRLTTSYLGLRQFARQNLAEVMLDLAQGQPRQLTWRTNGATFTVGSS